ncbi:DUF6153 family protein [Streptomyces sp. B21-097]|uniref:DUF6153 family protein n=1 Tax=Streptomyces sp. B21-097 TaxID=3039414 RepID=UPI002FF249D7
MTRPVQQFAAPPVRRRWGLLVFGVLVGLLAMHGLAPGGVGHEHGHDGNGNGNGSRAVGRAVSQVGALPRTAAVVVGPALAVKAHDDCAGGGGGCGGGHLQHADPTCAAAAVSGAPVLPALVPDPVVAPEPTRSLCPYAADAPDGARAPPSLAELQLLRI